MLEVELQALTQVTIPDAQCGLTRLRRLLLPPRLILQKSVGDHLRIEFFGIGLTRVSSFSNAADQIGDFFH